MKGGALTPSLEPVGEGPFAYPSGACVFSLPALLLHPVISKLASSSLPPPTMEQSPTAKQRSPFQLGNPPCLCLCLYPSLAQCLGRAPPLSRSLPPWFCPGPIAEGLTCVSRVKNAETELGAAPPPQEWPNLYFCLWKNFPGSLEELVGRKVKLINHPV